MRGFIIGFLFFLAFVLPARWYFVCKLRHHCGEQPAATATRPMTLALHDGDKAVLQGYEQFGFANGAPQPDLSPNNREFLAKVAEYLKANPGRNITLHGRYADAEKAAKSGIFENIGIARAAAVQQLLAELGVDEKRFSIDHQLLAPGTALDEPISFLLYDPKPDGYDRPAYSFKDNTFSDANFEFGSDEFKPGEQCVLYADSVKAFLDANPDMLLTITGHTDSIGQAQANLNLGLRRAKSAAAYFRELGVKSKIEAATKGEEQPIAPNSIAGNDHPEGRQKNRRVNFKITEKI